MMLPTTFRAAPTTLTAILGLAVALPAAADTGLDKYRGSADGVSIGGVVEVPLYSSPWGSPRPYVQVQIGEDTYLFALSGADTHIYLGDRVVADQELTVHSANRRWINLKGKSHKWKPGGEISYTDLESMKIGDVELTGVRALTAHDDEDEEDFYEAKLIENAGVAIDGVIGLGALPQLSWAILPSAGVVKLAPAGDGGALVTAVGGAKLPYMRADSRFVQFGKRKDRQYRPAVEMLAEVQVAGSPVTAIVEPAASSWVSTAVSVADDAPRDVVGAAEYAWLSVAAGDRDLGSDWMFRQSGFELMARVPDAAVPFDAQIGSLFLGGVDFAVDTSSRTLAVGAAATKAGYADPIPWMREAAEAALAKSIAENKAGGDKGDDAKGDDAKGDDAKADADKPKGDKDAYVRARNFARADSDMDRTLELDKLILAFDETACEAWMHLGGDQLDSLKIDDAIESLTKAGELSHSWWDLTFEQRQDMLEAEAKGDKPEDGPHSQQPSCHLADGKLAAAKLAKGDFADVERIYRERLDLDPNLATLWGAGALASGKTAAAQEPFRQSLKMDPSVNPRSRLGLAMLYDAQGDWPTAKGFFERTLEAWPNDPMTVQLWLDATRRAEGDAAAAKAAAEFASAHPDSPTSRIALIADARLASNAAAKAAEDAAAAAAGAKRNEAAAATAKADAAAKTAAAAEAAVAQLATDGESYFASEAVLYPRSAGLMANHARFLFLAGRLDEAAKAADAALALEPANSIAWLVKSDIATAQGDTDAATAALKSAGQSNPWHPGYAVIIGQL